MRAACLAAWLVLATSARATQGQKEPLPGAEGALSNDTFLPVNATAAADLARGDRAFAELPAELRAGGAQPNDAAWIAVLEAWHSGLLDSTTGDAVPPRPVLAMSDGAALGGPWPDADGSAGRRVEGVEAAVAWRLRALPEEVRALWTARFEPVAAQALDAALGRAGPRAAAIAAVERAHPLTASAARAALWLAELELEAGRADVARAWCARGLTHRPDESLRAALSARSELCDALAPAKPARAVTEAWRSARGLSMPEMKTHTPRPDSRVGREQFGGGVQAGAAFLGDDVVVVQSLDRITWFQGRDLSAGNGLLWNALLSQAGLVVRAPYALGSPVLNPPGWAMRPASDGRRLVCVHGRSDGTNSNALVCFDTPVVPPPALELGSLGPPPPSVRWIVHKERTLDANGNETPFPAELRGVISPDGEFQPGPLILGSQVLVQVRRGGRPPGSGAGATVQFESWLLALDLETGRPLWKRFLARGIELVRDTGRLSAGETQYAPGQPLCAADGLVFVGTHLGAAAYVDPTDGRLVGSLLSRRRDPEQVTWTGWTPEPAGTSLLWAPADSDQLYWLDLARDLASPSRSPFSHPPRAVGEGVALIGGDGDEAVVLSRAGMQKSLCAWSATSGGRRDALTLAPDEAFSGAGALSPERVLFASDRGVYLFDRTRELYLLDFEPFPAGPVPGGGDVLARGDRVYVVGRECLWVLAVEP